MTVKIFLGSIILLVVGTITGFAYWLFPVISNFHQAMGGKPLKDPRGDVQQEITDLLSFLPDNSLLRAIIVVGAIVAYFFVTTMSTLVALRIRRRREDKAARKAEQLRALNAYNARR